MGFQASLNAGSKANDCLGTHAARRGPERTRPRLTQQPAINYGRDHDNQGIDRRTGEQTEQTDERLDRLAMYRELQRAVPGLEAMYRLMHALILSHAPDACRVLVVGAGGGREIEELQKSGAATEIIAVDPSARNLETARLAAEITGSTGRVSFLKGMVEDLAPGARFDIATSLLVMHHIRDDGSKLAYLSAIRDRLAVGGTLIHADVCFDSTAEFDGLVPSYLAHANLVCAAPDATRLELEAIPNLSVVSEARIRALLAEAGFAEPCEVFRSLWYRCWIANCCRS